MEIRPSFENAVGEDGTTNVARPAYGLAYELTDALATYEGHLLAETGCLDDYPVFAEPSGGTLKLRVYTRARLRGFDLSSWLGADWRQAKRFGAVDLVVSTGSTTTFSSTSTVVSADQRWRNLSLATVMFRELDRGLPAGADWRDGVVHLQSTPSTRPTSCCSGRLRDLDNVLGNEPLGLSTGTDAPFRSRIARELRHVLSLIREGTARIRGCGAGPWGWWLGAGRCSR